jgi:hypothetical protein
MFRLVLPLLLSTSTNATPRLTTSAELDRRLAEVDARLDALPAGRNAGLAPGTFSVAGVGSLGLTVASFALLRAGAFDPTVGAVVAGSALLFGIALELVALVLQHDATTSRSLEQERRSVLAARAAVLRQRAHLDDPPSAAEVATPPQVSEPRTPPPLVQADPPRTPLVPKAAPAVQHDVERTPLAPATPPVSAPCL